MNTYNLLAAFTEAMWQILVGRKIIKAIESSNNGVYASYRQGLIHLKDPKVCNIKYWSKLCTVIVNLLTFVFPLSFIFCVWVLCLCLCLALIQAVPTEARRGSQIPRTGVAVVMSCHVGAGKRSVLLTAYPLTPDPDIDPNQPLCRKIFETEFGVMLPLHKWVSYLKCEGLLCYARTLWKKKKQYWIITPNFHPCLGQLEIITVLRR